MTYEKIKKTAEYIVDEIISDLSDRRGLRQEWNQIDEDIQEEIKDLWKSIAVAAMSGDMH